MWWDQRPSAQRLSAIFVAVVLVLAALALVLVVAVVLDGTLGILADARPARTPSGA